jgi:DNA-binding response OmpR family regulator
LKKILVADSDEALASFYSEELSEEGYTVESCSDPAKLMAAIVSGQPDLILIDMEMVMHPGEGFHREIKKHLSAVPPILYMSASRSRSKRWPFSSENFVRKSGSLDSLKKKITGVLGEPRPKVRQRSATPHKQMAFPW